MSEDEELESCVLMCMRLHLEAMEAATAEVTAADLAASWLMEWADLGEMPPATPEVRQQAVQAFVSLAGRVIAGGRHECPPAPTITLRLRLEDANGTLTEALLSVPVERFCHPDCICEEFERYGMAGASRIVAWKLEEP